MIKEIHHDYEIKAGQYYIRYEKDFNDVRIFLIEKGSPTEMYQHFVSENVFRAKGTKISLVKYFDALKQVTVNEIKITV